MGGNGHGVGLGTCSCGRVPTAMHWCSAAARAPSVPAALDMGLGRAGKAGAQLGATAGLGSSSACVCLCLARAGDSPHLGHPRGHPFQLQGPPCWESREPDIFSRLFPGQCLAGPCGAEVDAVLRACWSFLGDSSAGTAGPGLGLSNKQATLCPFGGKCSRWSQSK